MKRKILFIASLFIAFNAYAQENGFVFRGYISPAICESPIQSRVFKDGQLASTKLTKKAGLFFGVGLEVSKKMENNWLIGVDLGFVSKGYLATKDTFFSYGDISGTNYIRADMNFWQPAMFIEKQFLLKNPDYRLLLDAGLFYGLHVTNLIGFGLEANGNDFGTSISLGIQRKRAFAKLDYEKGLIFISNNADASFKTNILRFKIGFSFL